MSGIDARGIDRVVRELRAQGEADLMAKKSDTRMVIRLLSTESPSVYWTTKSRRTTPQRLELRKYDKRLKRHALFREVR